jgi:hypothetical protein
LFHALRLDAESDILSDMSTTTATDHYGVRLRDARKRSGMSLEEATFRARGALNRRVSTRTVGRLEAGSPGEMAGVDDVLVVTLCRLYGVEPSTVSTVIAERAQRAAQLLAGGKVPDIDLTSYAPWDSNPEPNDSRPGFQEGGY